MFIYETISTLVNDNRSVAQKDHLALLYGLLQCNPKYRWPTVILYSGRMGRKYRSVAKWKK